MIYVQIKGGLGNQLFQYAVGYYLKKELEDDLCLDYSSAKIGQILKLAKIEKKFSFRKIRLECLELEPHKTKTNIFLFLITYVLEKMRKDNIFIGRNCFRIFRENGIECRKNNSDELGKIKNGDNAILLGYWQNIHYIEPIRGELIRQFRISVPVGQEYEDVARKIQSVESVGVHVRRGDFVALGWDKGVDYYLNAMNAARKAIPNARFFLFSDDHEWVNKNLYNSEDCLQIEIKENCADVKEFELLRSCKHQIISESTFGWWAAYLNEYASKFVYIPFDCKGDIWLGEWKRIEYEV